MNLCVALNGLNRIGSLKDYEYGVFPCPSRLGPTFLSAHVSDFAANKICQLDKAKARVVGSQIRKASVPGDLAHI
jgi:hypothetical protein